MGRWNGHGTWNKTMLHFLDLGSGSFVVEMVNGNGNGKWEMEVEVGLENGGLCDRVPLVGKEGA